VILDSNGAESLLGKGDMLLVDPQKSAMQRAQGVMVSDQEIEKILNYCRGSTRTLQKKLRGK